jgi:hypothetical protein
MLKIDHNEKYQLYYLKKAINELISKGINSENIKIKEEHKLGYNYINNQKIPLTFPLYILDYINKIDKNKQYEYNFIGTLTDERKWVNKYKTDNSIIQDSKYGRNNTKYTIDENYYNIISKSKFTLTPTGDCPWSYRFFEAIMCLSIPILEKGSNDIYMKDYFCYFDNDKHIYNKDMAIKNYNKFVNSDHFLKNIKNLKLN